MVERLFILMLFVVEEDDEYMTRSEINRQRVLKARFSSADVNSIVDDADEDICFCFICWCDDDEKETDDDDDASNNNKEIIFLFTMVSKSKILRAASRTSN